MEPKSFKYEIGEKTYIQKPLVLGQVEQLMDLLKEGNLPKSANPWAVKDALGERIYLGLAIALVEEGKSPKRDLDELKALADELRWSIDSETILQVIEDFFGCNPIASILERLSGTMQRVADSMTGLKSLSSSFQKATSPGASKSSGVSAQKNANPSPDTASGMS